MEGASTPPAAGGWRPGTWRAAACSASGRCSMVCEGIALARGGAVAFAVFRNGVSRVDEKTIRTSHLPEIGVAGELTDAVAADATGTAWIVSANGSLVRGDGSSWKVYAPEKLGGI